MIKSINNPKPINLVMLGGFLYPHGMASTDHVQDLLDGLRLLPEVTPRVIVLRQSSRDNEPAGIHQGVPYETVMQNLLRAKALLWAPVFLHKARQTIDRAWRLNQYNVLCVYGPPSLDNISVIKHARCRGFKVVFYIVEDDDVAGGVSRSPWHRWTNRTIRQATQRIGTLTDGIMVISSRLQTKFEAITQGQIPLHLLPITVNLDRWLPTCHGFGETVTLFYAGSFGFKDGVPVLIEAFDQLASRHDHLRLVLAGKGNSEDMQTTFARMKASAYAQRITYTGYLNEEAFQAALSAADILCMTRIDHPYAQAGFPFKLGQYLATAKPVIASTVSDVPQWLQHRQSALLVKPGNVDDIVQSVEILLRHPSEAVAIGQRGREVARHGFCHKKLAQDMIHFMQSMG